MTYFLYFHDKATPLTKVPKLPQTRGRSLQLQKNLDETNTLSSAATVTDCMEPQPYTKNNCQQSLTSQNKHQQEDQSSNNDVLSNENQQQTLPLGEQHTAKETSREIIQNSKIEQQQTRQQTEQQKHTAIRLNSKRQDKQYKPVPLLPKEKYVEHQSRLLEIQKRKQEQQQKNLENQREKLEQQQKHLTKQQKEEKHRELQLEQQQKLIDKQQKQQKQ